MSPRAWSALLVTGCCLAVFPMPAAAQLDAVIHGRVEDAASGAPVAGARVIAPDSASAVFTDSLGAFALPVASPADSALAVHAERIGYIQQTFALGEGAPDRINVLVLEPAPLELPGIAVVDEAALTTLLDGLERRRQSYGRSVRTYDRSWFERFAPTGSALDIIVRRYAVFECGSTGSELCRGDPVRSLQNPDPTSLVNVCVDGQRSIAPIQELGSLDTSSPAFIEAYGGFRPEQIRVYTMRWLTWSAGRNQTNVLPLWMGC